MHKIGYYVNNHGTGHTNRLFCFVEELEAMNYDYQLFVFAENIPKILGTGILNNNKPGSNPKIQIIPLTKPDWKLNKTSKAFHSLPKNYKEYFKPIVTCCIEHSIETFVSDLSVEVGMAVRLHVDKLVYILLHGNRIDDPHQTMFYEADTLLVPFSEVLEDNYFEVFKQDFNLAYSGGFLKFQYQDQKNFYPAEFNKDKKNVLIILGTGGDSFNENYIDVNTNIYNVVILGKQSNKVKSIKFTNPYNYIRCADIVVANAGDSIMHEVSYFNRPYICIPEERPFKEQLIKAETLEREELAYISSWSSSLNKDILYVEKYPQKDKSVLIQTDKAKLYTNEIINCRR